MQRSLKQNKPDPRHAFYQRAIATLNQSQIPFLIGGAFALEQYTGIMRWTKDLDLFVYPKDCKRVLNALSASDYKTELTFPHWLGKAFCGEDLIDIIFSSGNGVCMVDDGWFEHAVDGEVFDMRVRLIPLEEMIWSKAFIMERERYDGADIAHILRACGKGLDWSRLLGRFGSHWRVLFSHLILFGFIYPDERSQIPNWVTQELLNRLRSEMKSPQSPERVCQGTLLSLAQYRTDVECWGYGDARLIPRGNMTSEEIAHWTEAFEE